MNKCQIRRWRSSTAIASCQISSGVSLESPFSIRLRHSSPLCIRLKFRFHMDKGRIRIGTSSPAWVAPRKIIHVWPLNDHFSSNSLHFPNEFRSTPRLDTCCIWNDTSTTWAHFQKLTVICFYGIEAKSRQIGIDDLPLGPRIISISLMNKGKIGRITSVNTAIASGQIFSIIRFKRIFSIFIENGGPKRPRLIIRSMNKGCIGICSRTPAVVTSGKIVTVTSLKGDLVSNDFKSPRLPIVLGWIAGNRSRIRIGSISTVAA